MLKRIFNKLVFSAEVSSLGANVYYRVKFFILNLWLPIKKRLSFKNEKLYFLKLKKFNKAFSFCIHGYSDIELLRDIFIKNEYDAKLDVPPKIIFDLGSNVGASVIFFKLKFSSAEIYAFEPDPKIFLILKKNTDQFEGVHVYNFAISNKSGKENFYINSKNSLSSSLIKRVPGQKPIEVIVKSLDALFGELDIDCVDILKFDIEGEELEALGAFKNLLKVRYFVGELHMDLIKGSKEDFLNIFQGNFLINFKKKSNRRCVLEIRRF